ncbi:hypothetical protein ACA910_010819 [Epithemia clementina (nom. ined.)]
MKARKTLVRTWVVCSSFFVQALALASSWKISASSVDPVASAARSILYDMPVSSNGARCRAIIYKKGLSEADVAILKPSEIGGLRSEEYLKINPQAKMPSLVCNDSNLNLAESDTIARFLMAKYAHIGPSFQPDNPKSNLIARLNDMYLSTIQGCMYKAAGPFGQFGTRKDAIAEYTKQLQVIEGLIDDCSMFLCGTEVSLADASLFPSCVFASYMLPKFDVNPPLPPKMKRWFNTLKESDSVFSKINEEIEGALLTWEERDRWGSILGAGWRDEEPGTIFDKILAGEIPAAVVKETEKALAFKDINPAAPAHVLVIPKDRNGLTRLNKATHEHTEILGHLMVVAAEVSRDKQLGFGDGARIVVNDGPDGGQEVMHLHIHVLGGRSMQWPPG